MKILSKGFFQKRLNHERFELLEGTLFIAPWLTGCLVFMLYPVFYSLYMTFFNIRITGKGMILKYVGLDNYRTLLAGDPVFPEQIILYLKENLLMIPIIVSFAFVVAILLNMKFKGRTFFRAVFFLPIILSCSTVVSEILVRGGASIGFFTDPLIVEKVNTYLGEDLAQPIVNVMVKFVLILWYSGAQILIFVAALQSIPKSLYEASRIDGATTWESFWKITLPGVVPFILLNLIYTIVDLFMMPTNPVLLLIQQNEKGYGYTCTIGWVYFLLTGVLILSIFMLFRQKAYARD